MSRHVGRVALAAAVLAGSLASSAGDARTVGRCTWTPVFDFASLSENRAGVVGIAGVSERNAWAVGYEDIRVGMSGTTRSRPLLAHWDGRELARTSSPIRWGTVHSVFASKAGIWATVRSAHGWFVLRWNGSRWRTASKPSDVGAPLRVVGSNDRVLLIGRRVYAWQSGRWQPWSSLGRLVQGESLWTSRSSVAIWRIRWYGYAHTRPPRIDRWDGSRWVPTATRLSRFTDLTNIVAFSRRNAWFAGTDGDHALVFRWDGTRWLRVGAPPRAAIDAEIYTTGARTLWLAGSTTNAAVTEFPAYLMRNDGAGWRRVTPPTREDLDRFDLYAIGREAWATSSSSEQAFRFGC